MIRRDSTRKNVTVLIKSLDIVDFSYIYFFLSRFPIFWVSPIASLENDKELIRLSPT